MSHVPRTLHVEYCIFGVASYFQGIPYLNVKPRNVGDSHGSQTKVQTALCLVHFTKGWCDTNLRKNKQIFLISCFSDLILTNFIMDK